MRAPTVDAIRAALACITPDLPRDVWARVAMALKSELGEAGFELFDTWSKGGETYQAKATRDTWESVKAGGRVKIGSLFHLAKAHGYQPEAPTKPTPADAAQLKARAKERRERETREQVERAAAQLGAAKEAERVLNAASADGHCPYLEHKGVKAHGVSIAAGGWLLVPVRDLAGTLYNVQRIAPEKPAEGPDKLFLKGGRKSGLCHCIGELKGAPVILIAEGYATAASLHEATLLPAVVAFDAGNLAHVARAVRKAHPAALLVICGDDDRETEANTGRNPGREAAIAAADRAHAVAIFPEGLPADKSDFNDMATHAGAVAVRDCVERAIKTASEATKQAPEGEDTSEKGAGLASRFKVTAEGVFYADFDQEGRPKAPAWVCSPLKVTALARDADGQDWSYVLEFADPTGRPQIWVMSARMLAGDGAEFRGILMARGLRIGASPRARALLTQYIQSQQPTQLAIVTDRTGWHAGGAFVTPGETLGGNGEPIVHRTDGTAENTLRQRGKLEGWREHVARYCPKNSRLMFAVSCAFLGPTLRAAGIGSGGFHLRGDSSCGKTTALRVAASVFGGASYVQRWRNTDNALESVATQHCDLLLVLDELGQVDSRVAGECAYLLANETSKGRLGRAGQVRPRQSWVLVYLSAGEIGLNAHMAEGGKRARVGQELRLPDIQADAGAGLGIFEDLHGFENGAKFAQHITKACEVHYGTAGRAFIEWLVQNVDTLREYMRAGIESLAGTWIAENASGQVERVGRRFAAVATAGELATEAGITGWPKGEATWAAKKCFDAWVTSRGGIGNDEDRQMLRQVRAFLEAHGEARFTSWSRATDDHAPKTMHRAGVRRAICDESGDVVGWEFFFLVEIFRAEVCAGFDYLPVLKLLKRRGDLLPDKGREYDCRPRLPGLGHASCYCVKSSILEGD